MAFTQNPYYFRNTQAADAISSGISAIAQAMLANRRNAINPAQTTELEARARLHDAQVQDLAIKQAQQEQMIGDARAAKRSGLANIFMSAGLDENQAGALAFNAATGKNIFPDMPQLYDQNMMPAINAARMTVASDLISEPTKVSGGGGGAPNLANVFKDALDGQYIAMAGRGELTPAQMQQINIMRSPSGNRYSNASDGVIIDQYQTVPTSAVVGNDRSNIQIRMKDDKVRSDIKNDGIKATAAANRDNTAAGLNRANTTLVNTRNQNLKNNGKEQGVIVADSASPTGYSYALPEGGTRLGAVIAGTAGNGNKSGNSGVRGKLPEQSGVFYETKDASQIDKITEKILGMDTPAPDGKARYPLPVTARTAIRMRVNQIAQEKGQSGKFTDADVYQAIMDINSDRPYLFQYTANMDEKGEKINPTQKNRVKQAGLAEIVAPTGGAKKSNVGGVSISNW